MSLTAPHQVAGPIYGAALHAVGGLRLPYLGAAALCALTSLAFLATAAVGSATSSPTSSFTSPTAEAAEGGAAAAAGGAGGVVPDSPPAAAGSESGQPVGQAQPWGGALRDAPTWRLCAFQALCCGTVRSCLDILLPLWLRAHHGFSTARIGRLTLTLTLT